MKRSFYHPGSGRIIMVGAFVAFTLMLMIIFYPWDENTNHGDTSSAALPSLLLDSPGQNIDLNEIANNPDTFTGKVVSVRGKIQENIGTRGLTVSGEDDSSSDVLIVSKQSLIGVGAGSGQELYRRDDGVRVSGKVESFNIQQIEELLGTNLNRDVYAQYEGRPVIVADSIVPLQEL